MEHLSRFNVAILSRTTLLHNRPLLKMAPTHHILYWQHSNRRSSIWLWHCTHAVTSPTPRCTTPRKLATNKYQIDDRNLLSVRVVTTNRAATTRHSIWTTAFRTLPRPTFNLCIHPVTKISTMSNRVILLISKMGVPDKSAPNLSVAQRPLRKSCINLGSNRFKNWPNWVNNLAFVDGQRSLSIHYEYITPHSYHRYPSWTRRRMTFGIPTGLFLEATAVQWTTRW